MPQPRAMGGDPSKMPHNSSTIPGCIFAHSPTIMENEHDQINVTWETSCSARLAKNDYMARRRPDTSANGMPGDR
jgi:hypothetical protein